jgi:aerobic-type carbon monoxide dehydrogenase small subunit (CoxS/CutS family)
MPALDFTDRLHLRLRVNGVEREVAGVDARVTLLDLLREHLDLTGAKKAATTASAAPARSCSTAAG